MVLKPAAIVILLVSLGAAGLLALPDIAGPESVAPPIEVSGKGPHHHGESNDGDELRD